MDLRSAPHGYTGARRRSGAGGGCRWPAPLDPSHPYVTFQQEPTTHNQGHEKMINTLHTGHSSARHRWPCATPPSPQQVPSMTFPYLPINESSTPALRTPPPRKSGRAYLYLRYGAGNGPRSSPPSSKTHGGGLGACNPLSKAGSPRPH